MKNKFIVLIGALFIMSCSNQSKPIDYGNLKINDVFAFTNFEKTEFNPIFSNDNHKEKLSYEYDHELINIDEDNFLIEGKKVGECEIKAFSEHFNTTFKVKIENIDNEDPSYKVKDEWENKAKNYIYDYSINGNDNKSTIFIGDSFFDTAFWSNFYDMYYGKDCLCYGIGSTTTFTWETLSYRFFKTIQPKNIVINCGTNTVYDINKNSDETKASIQRMLMLIHKAAPNAKIYYFTITHRTYTGAEEKYPIVNAANEFSINYGEGKSWLKVVDIRNKINWMMLRDGIHPSVENYTVFTNALNDANIEIEDN